MQETDLVKKEISKKWKKCQKAEKYGLEFGQACYIWRERLQKEGSTFTLDDVWKDLNISPDAGNRWVGAYMKENGIERLHIEKRTNRSEPPDSFEVLRKLAKKMLNLGFAQLRETNIDASHLSAAKTWALCRLEEKQLEKQD